MGLTVYLNIIDQTDIKIDDIDLLNKETEDSGIADLSSNISNIEDYHGFYRLKGSKLEIATIEDGEMMEYGSGWSNVHGTFYVDAVAVLARHVTSGKIVLMLDIEGNDNEYFVITPGNYTHIEKLTLANFPD